jgi:hypothetical protein
MPSDSNPTRFGRVLVLTMTALLRNQDPTIVFYYTKNFSNSHVTQFLEDFNKFMVDERYQSPRRGERLAMNVGTVRD